MHERPTSELGALLLLLQRWVDTAFPIEQDRNVVRLNFTWRRLAQALCGLHSAKLRAFDSESAQLGPASQAGSPPVHALEQRLRELIDDGLQEQFLVIAVRQAMDQLVAMRFPEAAQQWKQMADGILPLWIQFSMKDDGSGRSSKTYTYDSDL